MPRTRTSFTPGTSGNPRGRPKGAWGWRRRLLERAAADLDDLGQLSPARSEAIIARALAGDVAAMRQLLDRIERTTDDDGED